MTAEWRPVVFLHLPKTAGSSMRSVFYHQVGRERVVRVNRADPMETVGELRRLSVADQRNVAAIVGHMGYGIHEALGVPCTYVTMLRHPVERVLSLYAYLSRSPDSRLGWSLPEGMTLEAFVDDWEMAPLVHNEQTRLLAGPLAPAPAPATDETLAMAKRNMTERLVFTGLTERFDESVLVLQRVLEWRTASYDRRKMAPDQRHLVASSKVRERISERNCFDLELYALASERFEELVVINSARSASARVVTSSRAWSARVRSASRRARALARKLSVAPGERGSASDGAGGRRER